MQILRDIFKQLRLGTIQWNYTPSNAVKESKSGNNNDYTLVVKMYCNNVAV